MCRNVTQTLKELAKNNKNCAIIQPVKQSVIFSISFIYFFFYRFVISIIFIFIYHLFVLFLMIEIIFGFLFVISQRN